MDHVMIDVELEEAGAASGQVKSLAKGLGVLDMLLASPTVRTTDVAIQLGVDRGTASRILGTLVRAGYATRAEGRRFSRGAKLQRGETRRRAAASIRDRARPLLRHLVEHVNECAHLAVLADDQVLFIDKLDSSMILKVDHRIGTLAPLHCTALGKTFLAFSPVAIPMLLPAQTPNTIIAHDALDAELRRIVETGFATDDEENVSGVRCVAAPLRDADGMMVAALGLSGPGVRISANHLPELGRFVRDLARGFPGL